jgi:uncharacterized protein involved in outer membrane biogenesis
LQTTLLTLGIALILALVMALVGPLFVDWGRFRTDFEVRASRIAGQPVRITGGVDLRVLPTPTIRLQGIEIGPPGAASALAARGLDAELSLPALMRGQWRATVVRIDGPRLAVLRDPAGHVFGPTLAASDVAIDRVIVKDGRVSLTDTGSNSQSVLDQWSFDGELRVPTGPIRGDGTFVVDGQSFRYRFATSSAPEGIKLRLGLDPSDRALTIEAEGVLTFDSDSPRFDGSVVLAGPAGLALSSGQTLASDPWRIESKLKLDATDALFEQVDLQYGPDERAVRLTGTANLRLGANARLNGVLSAHQIDLDRALAVADTAGRLPVASLRQWAGNLAGILHPPIPLTLGIGVDAMTLGGATLQSVRADLKSAGNVLFIDTLEFRAPGFTQVGLSGRLDTASGEFVGPLAVDTPDPKTLVAWLDGVELADRALGPFRMRGDIALSRERIALDRAKGEYDRKTFEGRLGYRFATNADPARLEVALTAAQFDLDNAISLALTIVAGAGATGATFERPGEIALAVDLGRVTFAGVDAKTAKAKVTLDRSGLRVDSFSVADFGGAAIAASGQIDLMSGPPRGSVAVSLDAQRIDGLAALAAHASPKAAELLRTQVARIVPAKLDATLGLDPTPAAAAKFLARLRVDGRLGGVRVGVAAEGLGDMAALAQTDLHIDGRLTSDDGALLTVLGLDGLAGDKRPANLVWTANGRSGNGLKVEAKLAADGLDAAAAGTLRVADFDHVRGSVDLSVSAADVRWLARDAAFPVTFRTQVALSGNDISFSGLVGKAASATIRGQGSLTLGRPLQVDASIGADQIDAAGMLAAAIGAAAQGAGSANWSAQPFRPLPQIAGRIALNAEQATLTPAMVAKKLRASLIVTPQEVAFEGVTAALSGGTLSADGTFRSGPGGLSARGRLSLTNAEATSVIRAGTQPPVTGRLSSRFEVEGIGSNPAALVGSLNGSGSVTLEGAQIAGLDPKGVDTAVRLFERGTPIAPARIGEIVGRAMDTGSMSVPWVSVPLAISSGRVRLGKLVAPPQSNDLAVSGTLDLVDATLDARFTVFGAAAAGQRPEASIVLKGPLAAPRRSVDVAALINWLTMQSIDREAKRLDAAERAAKQEAAERAAKQEAAERAAKQQAAERAAKQIDAAAPGSSEAVPAQRETPIGTNVGANLAAPAAQPQAAPALPPAVTLSRPPGAMTPRALPPVQTGPPLLTPQ